MSCHLCKAAQVAEAGSVRVTKLMEVERYSHVMHISSTVKGKLLSHLDAWDALRAALPAGTISGAPKVPSHQNHGSLTAHILLSPDACA